MVNKNKGYYHHQQIRPERKKKANCQGNGKRKRPICADWFYFRLWLVQRLVEFSNQSQSVVEQNHRNPINYNLQHFIGTNKDYIRKKA